MRKQTKLVAVLSASALLAMGASLTAFAATGWTQEDGTWYYYDRDGERVTDEWRKSGDYWFYLGDDGEMVTDQLIEDDDDYYYVNADGAMISNAWVAIENEDAGDEDEPDQYWYYFQSNGKAYTGSDSSTTTKFKTINGKKYAFDEEGRMLYGWVKDGERQTGEDDWTDAEYYLGDENDGAMSTGWRLISITDESWDPEDDTFDEDQDRWFYFKSNGKRYANAPDSDKEFVVKTINGKKYGFDENGRMVAEWNVSTTVGTEGQATYTREWSYFSSPEDGARKTKGWFKVIPDEDLDSAEYDDAAEHWYYADGDGALYANVIKTINGRKYAFDDYGRMVDGLRLITFDVNEYTGAVSTKEIVEALADDDSDEFLFDTEDNLDATIKKIMSDEEMSKTMAFMYFGSEDDGAVKTGKQKIDIDGDEIEFEFKKDGSKKGQGRNEIDTGDKVIYAMGKRYKAGSDNKYEIVLKLADNSLVSVTTEDYVNALAAEGNGAAISYKNKKEDNKYYYGKNGELEDETTGEPVVQKSLAKWNNVEVKEAYVVNTSGSLVRDKSKCKDGDDYVINVDNFNIVEIYEELD